MQSRPINSGKAPQDILAQAWSCHQRGDYQEAERLYKKVLKKFPANFDALHLLGLLELSRRNFVEARKSIEQALRIDPKSARAHCNLGAVLRQLGKHDEALSCFHRALSYQPDSVEAHYNLGNTLRDLGRAEEALGHYDMAIRLKPTFAEAHSNRGKLLHDIGRHKEALESFSAALELDSALLSALSGRGNLLLHVNELSAALQDFDKFLSLEPDNAKVHNSRGVVLQKMERFKDALASFELALMFDPDYSSAHWNEALCRLTIGDWSEQTWKKYESGWQLGERQPIRSFAQPLWQGRTPITGKTILVHDEQGMGDTIQFARFVPQLSALGATIILQVQPALKQLMLTLDGASHVVTETEESPSFDYHCPLLSLPLALGIGLNNLPSPVSYLRADKERVEHWQERLGPRKGVRVGIVWSGNPKQGDDYKRSMPFSALLPLLSEQIECVSLQKDIRDVDRAILDQHKNILRFEDEIRDFADTAAIISQLDLVVTVCTSVAHLSAALGKPTWILLSHAPDWRWLRNRNDSPWYPTATLFRQENAGDWARVIDRVAQAFKDSLYKEEFVVTTKART